jgi:hypothetical protein
MTSNKEKFTRLIMPILLVLALFASFIGSATPVVAADSGPHNAGTGANVTGVGDTAWSGFGNITADDNNYATTSTTSTHQSNFLEGTNYGFSIPSNSFISGITVSIRRYGDTGTGFDVRDAVVSLIKGGAIVGDNKAATSTDWPNSSNEAAISYGSSSDLWGTTWTPEDINKSNFGVALSVTTNSGRDAHVDYMQVTVTYVIPTAITTISDSLTSYEANIATNHTITFTIPAGSDMTQTDKVQYDFPAGFILSGASVSSFQYNSGSGWNDLSSSSNIVGQFVTITRTGSGTLNPGTQVRAVFNSVVNPVISGSYAVDVITMSSSNTPKATGSASVSITPDITSPTVTINQASGQADPANSSPINFTVVFSDSVSDFVAGDVTISGTAGATNVFVTGSGPTYNVAVSGMTTGGTVIATIGASVAHDAANNPNTASSSTDNTVTYILSQGPNLPSSATESNSNGGTRSWNNEGNVYANDNNYANTTFSDVATSNYLIAKGFGFSIPSGATINGIQVTIERYESGGSTNYISDNEVLLVKNGITGGTNKAAVSTMWTHTAGATANYGGTGDLWGQSWTAADINNANFGVALSADVTNTPGSTRTANVDYIQITVIYTPASTYALTMTVSPTSSGTATDNTHTSPYASGASVSISASPATGYHFVNWTAPAGSFTNANADSTTFSMPSQAVVITANFAVSQYTISFDEAGGSTVADITQDYGSTVTAPANPTKEGYAFNGWSPSVPSTMPASNTTYVAQWTSNQYTITFNSNGGTSVDSITAAYGASIIAPSNPTKEGYTFSAWSPAIPATMPLNGAALTAQWNINSYTITFDSNGGSSVASITQPFGTAVTAPADPTRTGYTFGGWSPAVPATMPLNGAALTAQWNINSYTITFDSNGGSSVTAITQNFGTAVTSPAAPTKEGYTFGSWSPAVPTTMPASNTTCVAQWTPNQYTITFNSNGGSTVDSITAAYGASLTAPANPTREGYTFSAWSPAIPATMPLNGAALSAQWTANQYTITFNSNGGTSVDSITAAYGASITAPSNPTKEGYTFSAWSPAIPATMPLNGASLVAQWNINSYTITFNSNGGTSVDSITATYGASITAPSNPTKEGYTFSAWSPAIPATMPLNGAALSAQWTPNNYTITFDSNSGTSVASITQPFGTAVTAPADPTRTGYTFGGWNPAVPTTMPLNGASLVAQWNINSYTITFNSNGGSAVADITQNYGSAVTAPADPTKAGYTFAGWNPAVPATMPVGGAALTAQWTVNSYTITFDSNSGSAVTPIIQNFGTVVNAPSDPTKEGYTFGGWVPSVPATMPASNTTCVAQWTINQYTITFNSNGGNAVAPITQNYNTAVTAPPAPRRDGYTFNGWSPAVPATMPASDTTCVAQWTINQYTISFNSNGGSEVASITQDFATAVTAPANPTMAGYTFVSWTPAVPATMPSRNMTCEALWVVNRYTITFNSAGGSAVAPITQNYNTPVTAPAQPTREGYTFAGWNPALPATMPVGGANLTAQWTINQYTISFDSQGGTAVAPITLDYGSTVNAPANPTKLGYTFAGWLPAVPSTMPAADTTCVAQWTINSYTISFNSDGGSTVAPITQNFATAVSAPANPSKLGYTFTGWSPAVPATMPATDSTCVAQWIFTEYTLTINITGNGTVGKTQDKSTYHYGDVVTLTPIAAANWIFDSFNPGSPVTIQGNTTVNALFIGPPVKLGFKTASRTSNIGVPTEVIIVETQDEYGTAANVLTNTTINLYTTSGRGTFDTNLAGSFNGSVTSVVVLANHNSVDFYYRDNTVGTPTITITSFGMANASQVETFIDDPPPSKVVITSIPGSVIAGAVSGAITVQLQDVNGPCLAEHDTVVNLYTTSVGGKFDTNQLGLFNGSVNSITILNGNSSASAYYKDTTVGTPNISATCFGLSSDSKSISVQANLAPRANKLVITSQALSVNVGIAGAITIQVQDATGAAFNVTRNTTINLYTSSARGRFDTTESGAFNGSVTSVVIPAGANQVTFYYKDSNTGSPTITVTSFGLTSGTQTESVTTP